jgi:hypothetical protein
MLDLSDILAGIEKRMGFCDPQLSFGSVPTWNALSMR